MKDDGLSNYQKTFLENVRERGRNQDLMDMMIPIGSLGPEEVLQIYHNDYVSRLTEALGETYETVWYVLGDQEFFSLCRNYIAEYPSSFRNLGDYGRSMPEFLEGHEFEFLSDLAGFEWNFMQLFHGKRDPFSNALAECPAQKLGDATLEFVGSLSLHSWSHALVDLWNDRTETEKEKSSELYEQNQSIALFKTGPEVGIQVLETGQFKVLKSLLGGINIADALARHEDELAEKDVNELFRFLGSSGIVKGYDLKP